MKSIPKDRLGVPADLALYIFPGEHIIKLEYIKSAPIQHNPSSLHELYRLARTELSQSLRTWNPPLASLAIETDQETPGELHRYEALFGRDALRVAIDLLPFYPLLARKTIVSLAELQGTTFDSKKEEEPGRIPHEIRKASDLIARQLTKQFGWDWPYYGSVDTTPEFIRTIVAYCRDSKEGTDFLFSHYTNKDGKDCLIADALGDALNWIVTRCDSNPEHLLEFKSAIPGGIENQAWKDSWDAYFHSDGSMANHKKGVASVEIQRVVYDALIDTAELYENTLNKPFQAINLRKRALALREVIFQEFWTDEKGGYFVLATDRDNAGKLRQLKIRTSNMGHLLHSRLLEGDEPILQHYRQAIVRQLFSPVLLAGNGIRTLASDETRYRPGAYHNGSIWLWDAYFIVQGLHKHNYHLLANELSNRLLVVIDKTKLFPEFVRGDNSKVPQLNERVVDVWDEVNQRTNRIEQPPQQVQAWSVAAIIALHHYNDVIHNYATPSKFELKIIASI